MHCASLCQICVSVSLYRAVLMLYNDGITIQTVYMYMLSVSFGQTHNQITYVGCAQQINYTCLLTLVV